MKKILIAFVAFMFSGNVFAENIDIIVTGSLKGSTNASAQLIAKDSESGRFGKIKLNPIAPGSACKGFGLVNKRNGSTFITHYENYYQLVSKLKNNPACPYVSFKNAKPIFSKVQALYLIVKTNGKGDNLTNNALTLQDFKNKKLKIGYSGSSVVESGWHNQMNKEWGSDHVFVGYNGSSKMRAGMASEEVDAIWTVYNHFLRLQKQNPEYKIILKTIDQGIVDAPIMAELFDNNKLTRAFLGTWYVFNDSNNIAKILADVLEQDFKENRGNYGAFANRKKLKLTFNAKTQLDMEKSLGWDQY